MSEKIETIKLDKKRQSLEEEASAITEELTASIDGKEPIGISTPLVDEEGYPRAEIDVYRARHLRKRLNEIKFDHDLIMKQMEDQIFKKEAKEKEGEMEARKRPKPKPKFDPKSGKWVVQNWDGTVAGVENGHLKSFEKIGGEADEEMQESHNTSEAVNRLGDKSFDRGHLDLPAFAKIENVMMSSPAQDAGFKKDDLIVQFGTIDFSNNRHLRALGEIVTNAYSDGEGIIVRIARVIDDTEKQMTLKLKPKEWIGKGLVGCTFSIHQK